MFARDRLSLDIDCLPHALDPTLPYIVVCADTVCALSLLHIKFCAKRWDLRFGYEASWARKGPEVLDASKKHPVTGSDSIRRCEIRHTSQGNLQSM